MNNIKRFIGKEAGPLIQFIKYGIAGGLAMLTYITLFFAIGWRLLPCLSADDIMVRLLGIAPVLAEGSTRAINAALTAAMAFMVANAVAYVLNILFVFKGGRHHWLIEISFFYLVSAVSMAIGIGLQSLLIWHYHIMTTLAFGTNLVSSLMINYAMRKYFIFGG